MVFAAGDEQCGDFGLGTLVFDALEGQIAVVVQGSRPVFFAREGVFVGFEVALEVFLVEVFVALVDDA